MRLKDEKCYIEWKERMKNINEVKWNKLIEIKNEWNEMKWNKRYKKREEKIYKWNEY